MKRYKELKPTKMQNNLSGMLPFSLKLFPLIQHFRILIYLEEKVREKRERKRERDLNFFQCGLCGDENGGISLLYTRVCKTDPGSVLGTDPVRSGPNQASLAWLD